MRLELRIPRRLESPNKSRGAHWRVRHRISQEWEQEIHVEVLSKQRRLGRAVAATTAAVFDWAKGRRCDMPVPQRMRVEIERHVPSKRNFIQDSDNLAFCGKPVLDALKRQGYIKNDSQKWLDYPYPTQHVSADGKDWTIVRISPATNNRINV